MCYAFVSIHAAALQLIFTKLDSVMMMKPFRFDTLLLISGQISI